MAIKFACPSCNKVMSVPDNLAGKRGKCKCGKQLQVPGPSNKSPAAAGKTSQGKAAASPSGGDAAAAPSGPSDLLGELTESDYGRTSPYEQVYAPPKSTNDASTLKRFTTEQDAEAEKTKKGIGTTAVIIAILNFLDGAALIAAIVLLFVAYSVIDTMGAFVPIFQLGFAVLIGICSVFATVFIVGGVGLLMKKSWGWFLTAMMYVYFVIDRLFGIVVVFMDGFEQGPFFGALISLVIMFLIASFLFNSDTREAFGVKKGTLPLVAAVLGLVLGLAACGATYAMVYAGGDDVQQFDDAGA